jgi:hypothetical protein
LPARELFVDWLDAFQGGFARWEGGDYLAIELVAGADLDGFHVVENIEAGEGDGREAVEAHAVAGSHGIKPADAARAARRGAIFTAAIFLAVVAEGSGYVIEQLSRERPVSDSSAIALEDADNALDIGWADAHTKSCARCWNCWGRWR